MRGKEKKRKLSSANPSEIRPRQCSYKYGTSEKYHFKELSFKDPCETVDPRGVLRVLPKRKDILLYNLVLTDLVTKK